LQDSESAISENISSALLVIFRAIGYVPLSREVELDLLDVRRYIEVVYGGVVVRHCGSACFVVFEEGKGSRRARIGIVSIIWWFRGRRCSAVVGFVGVRGSGVVIRRRRG
jgi:hypothetical protein